MSKVYRAQALDTGEWVYGGNIFFAGGKPTIMIEDDDSQELIAVNIATSSHSVSAYDADNIQLYTHDIVYAKHSSGTALIAEVLEIANQILLKELETGSKQPLTSEYTLKLIGTSFEQPKESFYPF